MEGVLGVLQGGALTIKDAYSKQITAEIDPQYWDMLHQVLLKDSATLAKEVSLLSEAQLTSVFVKPVYGSYARNIEAIIEHAYYHLGQLLWLKKGLENKWRRFELGILSKIMYFALIL
ncbi:MAG: hypothetical protein OIF50_13990 [Flavobacteriaceae bacterium]|nr:hypothetical protein [Flavobacteriaceae bacterium]